MLATSKITKKNQTTLPKAVIEALNLKPADRLVYQIEDGNVLLLPKTGRLADLATLPSKVTVKASLENMQKGIVKAVTTRYRRSLKKQS